MEKHDRQTLRLTLPKDLVLECQRTLEQQGVPLNVIGSQVSSDSGLKDQECTIDSWRCFR